MREVVGNIWKYLDNEKVVICITTNGTVTNKGNCVMGRGNAKEATAIIPGIQKRLGRLVTANGNIFQPICRNVFAFPTKHNWFEKSDIGLIESSAKALAELALANRKMIYLLPRPGCGNGKLRWKDVKFRIEHILPDNVLIVSN